MGAAFLNCSSQFPCLLGLGKPGKRAQEAPSQPAVAKPHFAKIGFLDEAAFLSCSSQFLCLLGRGKPGKRVQEAPSQPAVAKPHFAKIGCFDGPAFLSCSSQFPCLLGLGKPGNRVQKAPNHSTILKPNVANSFLLSALREPPRERPSGQKRALGSGTLGLKPPALASFPSFQQCACLCVLCARRENGGRLNEEGHALTNINLLDLCVRVFR